MFVKFAPISKQNLVLSKIILRVNISLTHSATPALFVTQFLEQIQHSRYINKDIISRKVELVE